ncbi:MAG: AraC family transcriptional regulator [Turicibacter sp.]|nr:AraC family transcriptional regulator [Turicibacter sp.]
MREKLIEQLSKVTAEEQAFLDGGAGIDYGLYGQQGLIESDKLLKSGKLVEIRPHIRFAHFPPHRHDYIEMVYMLKGSTTHVVNGRELVLEEGDILFLNTRAVQEIKPAGAMDIAINFIILPEFFNSMVTLLDGEKSPFHDFLMDSLMGTSANADYLYFNVALVGTIQNLVENLLHRIQSADGSKHQIIGKTMGLLFLELMHHTDFIAFEHSDVRDRLVMDVLKYIDLHYQEATLTELAHRLNYDLYWLSKEIKKQSKKTFKQLLKEKRLSVAKHLLKNSTLTIDEIIALVGYENTSYFYRLFRESYGESPGEFRASGA